MSGIGDVMGFARTKGAKIGKISWNPEFIHDLKLLAKTGRMLGKSVGKIKIPFKRGCTLIFKLFRNTFWVKISKTLKLPKNCFYLIKSDQDQIFRAQIWPKGPDLGFGQISIGNCQNFSKVRKVDFF